VIERLSLQIDGENSLVEDKIQSVVKQKDREIDKLNDKL
jgi:hypothetical protein